MKNFIIFFKEAYSALNCLFFPYMTKEQVNKKVIWGIFQKGKGKKEKKGRKRKKQISKDIYGYAWFRPNVFAVVIPVAATGG